MKTKNQKILESFDLSKIKDMDLDEDIAFDFINGKSSENIYIEMTGKQKKYNYVIFDCMGVVSQKGQKELEEGIYKFEVPPAGLIQFKSFK